MNRLPQRRKWKTPFFGIDIVVTSSSIAHTADCYFMSVGKEMGVDMKFLPSLFLELDVGNVVHKAPSGASFETLLNGAKKARATVSAEINALEKPDGASVVELVNRREATWTTIDPSIVLEAGLYRAIAGEVGVSMLHEKVMAQMPTAERKATEAGVLESLQKLSRTSLAKFVGDSEAGVLSTCCDLVQALAEGRPPSRPKNPVLFIKRFVDQLQYFLRVTVKVDQQDKTLTGPDAASHILAVVLKNPKQCGRGEFSRLRVFEYLLSTEQRGTFNTAYTLFQKENNADSSTAGSSSSSTAPPPTETPRRSRKRTKDSNDSSSTAKMSRTDTMKSAMLMFQSIKA